VVLTQARPAPELRVETTYVAGSDEARTTCAGDGDLRVTEGDEVTVCIEVVNDGDTSLAELDVVHRDLELDLGDFTVVAGDPAAVLRPGDAVVLAAVFDAGPSVFGAATATAVAVDPNAEPLGFETVTADGGARLDVDQELTLPGVGAAFAAGWNALAVAAKVVVLGLAVALPFVWLPVVALVV